MPPRTDNGFVILTSTIVLGTVLLLITLSAGLVYFFLRDDTADLTIKQHSYFLAQTCLEQALLELAKDEAYTGNETLIIDDDDQCRIQPIQQVPPNLAITATASESGTVTTLVLTVDSDLNAVSLEEQ